MSTIPVPGQALVREWHAPYAPGTPPVYCPFDELAIEPPAQAVNRTAAWLREHEFLPDPAAAQVGLHTGLTFTYCLMPHTRPEVLDAINYYNVWGFALDDRVESLELRSNLPELSLLLSALVRIADCPAAWTTGEDALLDAWQDIILRMRASATPTQMRRFTDGFQRWMFFYGVEAAHQGTGHVPDLSTYCALRAGVTGIDNFIAEYEIALDVRVPSEERDQAPVRAACEAALLTASLDNDRYSLAKSRRHAEHNTDLFTVLGHADPTKTFPELLVDAVAIRDRCLWTYVRLRDQLLPTAGPELVKLFSCLENTVAGNLSFGGKALRYLACDNTLAEATWTSKPSDPDPSPLPIPSIAWWWDQLKT